MASIKVVSPLPLAEQAKALSSFLSKQNQPVLPDSTAYAIATSLALFTPTDSKKVAQLLRGELKAHGITLSQSHSYEALARLCGFENWMRARVHFASEDSGHAREGWTMRLVPVAGEASPFEAYDSLPKLANEIIAVALERLGKTDNPASCTLLRGRKGLRVEFEMSDQLGFSFEVLSYETQGDDIRFVDLEAESIRGFACRMERAIEMGHPGAIVSGTVTSPTLPHWYHPTYVLKSLRNHARDVMAPNELQLFVMLEAVGFDADSQLDFTQNTVFGTADDIRVEAVWVSQESEDVIAKSLTPTQFRSLVERYLRLKRVLRQPFSAVMMLLATGTTDTRGYFPIDKERLTQSREELDLSLEQLANQADISVLDLARIEKYGHAHEAVIDKLAKVLWLGNGNALLPAEGEEGTGVRLDTADSLMRALSDTHLYRCIISDHFSAADKEAVEGIAQNIQECGDLVQVSEGVFDEVFNSKVSTEALKQSLQGSLDELTQLGCAVVVSRSVRYAPALKDAPAVDGMPMHALTLFFERVDKLRAPDSAPAVRTSTKEAFHG